MDEKVNPFCVEEYPFQTFDQDGFRKIIDLKIKPFQEHKKKIWKLGFLYARNYIFYPDLFRNEV